jgi:GTP cyclohydrolase I
MTDRVHVLWDSVNAAADIVAARWMGRGIENVYGVPRGGVVPAVLVAQRLGVPVADGPGAGTLVIDDLVDSGATAARWQDEFPFDALFRKSVSPPDIGGIERDGWLVFPWEGKDEAAGPTDAVMRLLQHIGEDVQREGLLDTPKRVVKALTEMTTGYELEAAQVLGTTFNVGNCDELVVVSGIHFDSLCEHHMLPFSGTAAVGYLPGERVVGLSKLARLVEMYARRLQVQERMTTQIATAIMDHLGARAAGVIVSGSHSCMSCRGVRKRATMTTSAMLGRLRDEAAMRAEFLDLVRLRDSGSPVE